MEPIDFTNGFFSSVEAGFSFISSTDLGVFSLDDYFMSIEISLKI